MYIYDLYEYIYITVYTTPHMLQNPAKHQHLCMQQYMNVCVYRCSTYMYVYVHMHIYLYLYIIYIFVSIYCHLHYISRLRM